jgi:hypothetical protein
VVMSNPDTPRARPYREPVASTVVMHFSNTGNHTVDQLFDFPCKTADITIGERAQSICR